MTTTATPRVATVPPLPHLSRQSLCPPRSSADTRLLARRELPVGRAVLSPRQPAPEEAAHPRARQAASPRPLGNDARPELHLRAPQPGHQGAGPGHDLRHRTGPWRSGPRRERLSRGNVQRGLPADRPRRGRPEAAVQAVFVPGGIPSHVAPETPGSIHEGGELGYALSHAFGAAFDNPALIVACVVGDGEAETGPLATSWHSNKFLDPKGDGAVLPILHLNGYKIANPCVLARIPHEELEQLFDGYGYEPLLRRGRRSRRSCTSSWLTPWTTSSRKSSASSGLPARAARRRAPVADDHPARPEGWTGPKEVDGKKTEGSWRSHQVPMGDMESPAMSGSSRNG